MKSFDDRKKQAEHQFSNLAQSQFKIEVRRNKLLGLWLSEKIGFTGAKAESYANEVIKADMEEIGDEDVFRKLRQDCDQEGIQLSDDEIRAKMKAFHMQAQMEIEQENKS